MNQQRFQSNADRRGMAMMYACFAVVAAATTVAVAMNLSLSGARQAKTKVGSTKSKYMADAAVEQAKIDLTTAIANWATVPTSGSATVHGLDPYGDVVDYTVVPTGFNTIATDPAGIQTIVTGYEVNALATVDGFRHTAHRLVNSEATPIFQFAVFYTSDLEINPGPNMTLSGRVHSNSDMYLNCGGTLTVNTNYVHAVGSIYRRRKDDTALSQGTVNVRNWVLNPYSALEPSQYFAMKSQSQMAALGVPTSSGFDSDFSAGFDANGDGDFGDVNDWYDFVSGALTYWAQPAGYTAGAGATIKTGKHGITQAAVPHIGSIKMFEPSLSGDWVWDSPSSKYIAAAPGTGTHSKGYYHANADLSIIRYANGTVKAYNASGTDITATLPGVITSGTTYDARQANGGAGNISIVDINLGTLKALNKWPANGLIYAASYGAGTGTAVKGIQLSNASTFANKLTVVSEDSVYIKGNYNSVNKKGAAVIADAVNLLSSGWNNSKTSASGLPTASNTTYNVAIVTGNQTTIENGQYNGGLENLPRFHENWSGKTCTISGAFVNTWTSEYAAGNWVYGGNRYQAPTRAWSYDSAFNTVSNLPPFTPMAVTAVDVCAW